MDARGTAGLQPRWLIGRLCGARNYRVRYFSNFGCCLDRGSNGLGALERL